jgi:hypothetical protein
MYTLSCDQDALGGVRVFGQRAASAGQDTVTISEAGQMLAEQIAALRDEQAKALNAEERYAAAQSFGTSDYAADVEAAGLPGAQRLTGMGENDLFKTSQAINVASKQGTIVTVASIVATADPATAFPFPFLSYADSTSSYIASITRQDGLQINLALNEDIRVNDLEDGGLAVYFAQSGITHMYDAAGNKSVLESEGGALAGTAGDDILINRFGSFVDAGDGDDTIINFAHNATILGGNGDDKIFVPVSANNVSLDGGAGNDLIVAHRLDNSTITMLEGDDRLVAGNVSGTIESAGNDVIRAGSISGAIHSDTGGLHLTAAGSIAANISLGDADNTIKSRGSIAYSQIKLGDGNNTIDSGGKIEKSSIKLGDGDNTVNTKGIYGSTIKAGDGDNIITAKYIQTYTLTYGPDPRGTYTGPHGDIELSSIKLGNGNNTIYSGGKIENSSIKLGDGDNTVKTGGLNEIVDQLFKTGLIRDSTIQAGNGNNTISSGNYIERATIQAGNGNNSVDGHRLDLSKIQLGDGNNTINADSLIRGTKIQFGNGDNTVNTGFKIYSSKIQTGDGNNTIITDNLHGSIIRTGAGNDSVIVRSQTHGGMVGSLLDTGGGNDSIEISNTFAAMILAGSGSNMIKIGGAYYSYISGGGIDDILEIGATDSSIVHREASSVDPWLEMQAYLQRLSSEYQGELQLNNHAATAGGYLQALARFDKIG